MAVVANLDVILGAKIDTYIRDMKGGITTNAAFQKQLKAAGLTQREWNSITKLGQKIMQDSLGPLERARNSLKNLQRLRDLGLIDAKAQQAERQKVIKGYQDEVGITEERIAIEKAAAKVREQSLTANQKFDQQLASHNKLLELGKITELEYESAVRRSIQTLADATGATARKAKEEAEAQRIIAGLDTAQDRYNRELKKAEALNRRGLLTDAQLVSRKKQLNDLLLKESGITAERNRRQEKARSIIRGLETAQDKYNRELQESIAFNRIGLLTDDQLIARKRQLAFELNRVNVANRQGTLSFISLTDSLRGFVGVASIGFGVIAGIKNIGGRALELDRQLTQSTAIVRNATAEQKKLLQENALDVARATKFSAGEAAEAYFFLFSAGLDVQQSLRALPEVAKFAQAGMFDLATATDLATDAQSALGLTVKDAEENLKNLKLVTDTLVGANTLANASVQQFSESLTNRAGASMKQLDIDLREGVAVLAAFADQGRKGQRAGEQFAIVMRDLTTKAIQNKEAFKDLGINVFTDGDFQRIPDILRDMERAFAGLTDEGQKTALLDLGFTDKSIAGLTALLGTSEKIENYFKQLQKTKGATKEVADAIRTELDSSLDKLGGSIDKLAAKGIPLFNDSLKETVDNVTFLTDSINELFELFGSDDKKVKVELDTDLGFLATQLSGKNLPFRLLDQIKFFREGNFPTILDFFKDGPEDPGNGSFLDGIRRERERQQKEDAEKAKADVKGLLQQDFELTKLAGELKKTLVTPVEEFKKKTNELKLLLQGDFINKQQFDALFARFEEERDKAVAANDPNADQVKRLEQLKKLAETPLAKNERELKEIEGLFLAGDLNKKEFDVLFDRLAEQRERIEDELNRPDPRVAALERSLETPIEKAVNRINELKELSKDGLISKDLIDRAIDRELGLLDELEAKQNRISEAIDVQGSAARGSAEAFRIIFGQRNPNAQRLDKANRLNEKQVDWLRDIFNKLDEQNEAPGGIDQNPIQVNEVNWN